MKKLDAGPVLGSTLMNLNPKPMNLNPLSKKQSPTPQSRRHCRSSPPRPPPSAPAEFLVSQEQVGCSMILNDVRMQSHWSMSDHVNRTPLGAEPSIQGELTADHITPVGNPNLYLNPPKSRKPWPNTYERLFYILLGSR